MTCLICKHGETHPGKVTVTLQRRRSTVIIKGVPGDVCENCGEYYLSDAVTERVLSVAEEAVAKDAEVEIVRYSARPSRPELATVER
ncbi:MAG: type II toxin-antitoxin system MqsA family antitoxin [Planctomycetes bacterium]|nr:type II toxin-antitoxin system MqsA family antitoxin [Planctomycetota bacterium]